MTKAEFALKHGAEFPFDAPDEWWDSEGIAPPVATDWAHAAARGVLADLKDRGGIKHMLHDIDEETRIEIIESLAAIIRAAAPAP